MRIAFFTIAELEFGVDSAYQVPLGGSESALCYLAEALAQQGHEVFLLHNTSAPGLSRGVHCLRAEPQVVKTLQPLDALVVQNATGWARVLPPLLLPNTLLVLWTQHAPDQPAMRSLHDPDERGSYAGIAFVSEWQRRQYQQHFGIDPQRSAVLRNAIGPAFGGLFADGSAVLARKSRPPVLAYTSTPFRGLNVLLDMLPEIRRRVPGTRLKVYSSLRVYQFATSLDEAGFGQLYRQCRETDGVEYVGSVPQPVLAGELRSVALLAYPNTFKETSCIAALEAMAAGCWIVTSDLAALPETTAGFARLIPVGNSVDVDYRRSFVEAVVEVLGQFTGPAAAAAEAHLHRQTSYVNESCTWPVRAQEWVDWLSSLRPRATLVATGQGLLPGPASTSPAPAATGAEVVAHFNLGVALQSQGRLHDAVACYQKALGLNPNFAEAHNNLGLAQRKLGLLDAAVASYHQALRLNPNFAEAHNNLGNALQNQHRFEEALASYHRALQLKPNYAEAHNNLGFALQSQNRLEEALASYHRALGLNSNFAEAHYNVGNALQSQGRLDEALASYRRALQLNPNLYGAHYNLGNVLQSQGQLDEAAAAYHQALRLNPNFAEAHSNLGSALQSQGRLEEAVACYRQALLLKPDFAEANNNLGLTLAELDRMDEAVACFRRVVQLKPDFADAHANLAGGLREQGQVVEAIACYRRAVQLEPSNPAVLAQLVSQLQQLCLWDHLGDLARRVIETVAIDAVRGSAAAAYPFMFLALPIATTAHQHLQCARRWVEQRLRLVRSPKSEVRSQDMGLRTSDFGLRTSDFGLRKITVGYVSADFHEHPIAHLIPELLEKHDRERFAIFGYSYGPDDGSSSRRRLAKACDRFVELRGASYMEAARRIEADEVDILVDLTGYTKQARTQILALRPAPIQVNYLGYPGTMAAPFIDYILVDDFIVPPDQQPYFTEKLVHLPGCYQVNDSQRQIADHTPSRAECGLPEAGFVFCCFNNTYKITPEIFEVWMGLLKTVPESVLWLLQDNPFAPANLRKEAGTQGVTSDRLVFAPRLPLAEHLARHRLADLFLDTASYNAHVTASDALWAGCPVLTISGQTFPSRVAGSLLRTIGLPELITTSLQQYQELALSLARDANRLDDLRARLQANRKASRLFDGGQVARRIEEAFLTMWKLHTSGEEPRAFTVPHQPEAQAR